MDIHAARALVLTQAGSMQGKALTATVRGIHVEFAAALDTLQKVAYDPLDMTVTTFEGDYARFCSVSAELERRLSAVITQVSSCSCGMCRACRTCRGAWGISGYAILKACLISCSMRSACMVRLQVPHAPGC